MPPSPDFTTILNARLNAIAKLDPGEAQHIARLASRSRERYEPNAMLPAASAWRSPHVIATGWVGLAHQMKDGGRQIVQLLLPGDVVGLGPQPMPGLVAFALTSVATLPLPEIHNAPADDRTGLAARRDAFLAEQCFLHLNHIVRLGRSSAYCRVANLLAELHWRLAQRGLATSSSFVLALTQEHIGDTLGLSYVHVNRTLQQLRREKLIWHEPGRIVHLNTQDVIAAGGFTPPVQLR